MNFKEIKKNTEGYKNICRSFRYCKDCSFSGLYGIYSRPSKAKIDIYEYWERYFHQIASHIESIRLSGNTFSFSIYCLTRDNDGILDLYWITPSYNRVIRGVERSDVE